MSVNKEWKTGIGQDSHRVEVGTDKPLILGGLNVEADFALSGNSDADVVLHSLTNAISGVSGVPILGAEADRLCGLGITDSAVYLQKAIETLFPFQLSHISISIEAARPKILPLIPSMKKSISQMTGLATQHIAITATTGEGLTAFGRGEGIFSTVVVTCFRDK